MRYLLGQEIEVNNQSLRVDSQLGCTSFHNVYRCTRLDNCKDVVLKRRAVNPNSNYNPNQMIQESFAHFDRTRAQLVAAGIPNVHFCDDTHALMDYVRGKNLDDLPPLPGITDRVAHIRDLLLALIEPMEALRTAGLVHRDIKPSNIMTRSHVQPSERGSATLIDLDSLAPIQEKAQSTSVIFGTPQFMSPEVANNGFYQFGSDVYALGVSAMTALEIALTTRIMGTYTSYCSSFRDYAHERQCDTWLRRSKWRDLPDYLRRSPYAPDPRTVRQVTNFMHECLHLEPSDRPKNGEAIRQLLTDSGNLSEV